MRWTARILGVVLVVLLAGAGAGYLWLRGSLPQVAGVLALPGLSAPVTVSRDPRGIPRIEAGSDPDAYFALGFVHAQDRLWQMEFQRRIGAGRLAELLGPAALPVDRFMRTLGLYHLAEGDLAGLDAPARQGILAYVAGVNAFLARHSGPLPIEFLLTGDRPEPWTAADVLVWARVMAFQLSTNWRDELLRADVARLLPPAMVGDLWPGGPTGDPVTVGLAGRGLDALLAAIPPELEPRLDSNEWAVAGSHTASGKPILANDPHLDFAAPILWYLASLESPGLRVGGATIPGLPVVILGHNADIAWGMTTTTADTMDLFVERPAGDGYLTPDGPRPYAVRRETIRVKGAADVVLTVRATRHGPVVSDLVGADAGGGVMALAASFLQPRNTTAQAFFELDRARDWDDFLAALGKAQMPEQNYAYADRAGHIGFATAGLTPIRKSGDGTVPQPGWSGDNDWTGWVPMAALPRAYDPPSGIIVNANNRVAGAGYPYLLAATWPEAYRARRILQMLDGRTGLTAADMAAMQMDELSLMARQLAPALARAREADPRAEAARRLVAGWDDVTAGDRPEPLIFESWVARFQIDLLAHRLGALGARFGALRPLFLAAVLAGPSPWCGEGEMPASCDPMVARALVETLADLSGRYGDDVASWRWADAHRAVFDALLLCHVPVLDRLTTLAAGTGGDGFTVQRGAFSLPDFASSGPALFAHRQGAGLRAVYDTADLAASRFMIATGQSGNPLSDHWNDLFAAWRRGELAPLASAGAAGDILVLRPDG